MTSPTVPIFQLVYISSTHDDLSKEQLLALLESSRVNNHQLAVSGMLLYRDHSVIQVLEGEELVVKRLFEKIRKDRRHGGVKVVYEGRSATRDFSDWSMGFRDLETQAIRDLPGYAEFLNLPLTGISGSQSRQLLGLFKSVGGWLPAIKVARTA